MGEGKFHEEKSKKSLVSCRNVFQYHGCLPNSNKKKKKKKLDEDKPFHEEKSKKSHVSCKNVFQYHGGLPNSNNKIKNKKSYMTTNGFDGENYIAEIRRYIVRDISVKLGTFKKGLLK
jgi:hypothetical protein